MTGAVTAVGSIIAYKAYEKFTGASAHTTNPENSSQQAVMNARDMLLLASPGADKFVQNPAPPPQSSGVPAEHMMMLMEENAQLKADMAQLQGFMAAQQAQEEVERARLANLLEDDD